MSRSAKVAISLPVFRPIESKSTHDPVRPRSERMQNPTRSQSHFDPHPWGVRGVYLAISTALTLVLASAPGFAVSSQVGASNPPSDLLRTAPFDRITLIDGTVLVVEPISPRPLPDPAQEKAKAKAEAEKKKGGVVVGKLPEPLRRDDDRANMLPLHTLPPDPKHFLVKPTSIQKVEYFEDMLLSEAEKLANRAEFDRAFEYILAAQSRNPSWPGLRERADRVLLLEARDALSARRLDQAIRILSDLRERSFEREEVLKLLGEALSERVKRSFQAGAFALGRRELKRLEEIAPGHPEIITSRQRFIARARELASKASEQTGPDRVEGLAAALRVWPADLDIQAKYKEAFIESPVLDVAVNDIPREFGPWIRSAAERRISRLVYLPILADASEQARKGERSDQLAAGLEASELGRRVRIAVQPGHSWSDGSRAISAVDLARSLADRALPDSPAYQARWAHLLEQVQPLDRRELELVFSRSPLSLDTWLLDPVGPAHSGRDGRVWTSLGSQLIASGRFAVARPGEATLRLDRTPHDSSKSSLSLARLHEHPYGDGEAAVGSLLRAEVQLLEDVPHRRLADLARAEGIKLGTYKAPRMHWIALDGRNPALQNRSLRRALSFALDRKALLEDFVLGKSSENTNQPSDGPFPVDSYANAPDVQALEYDPLLARLLVTAAKTELGLNRLSLRLEYPSAPAPRAVVAEIAEIYESLGIDIQLIERPADDLERELRAGRRFDLAYRFGPITDPIFQAGPVLCPGYDAPESVNALGAIPSPRILQLLLELERAPDFPSARGLAIQLDLESRDELPLLPLWQLTHHYAWRAELTGPSDEAEDLYQGIESWSLTPWIPDTSD